MIARLSFRLGFHIGRWTQQGKPAEILWPPGPFWTVVPKTMWTAICNQCGRDLFADGDHVAWLDPDTIGEVIGSDGGYWRCECGAPLDQVEAEAQAEALAEQAADDAAEAATRLSEEQAAKPPPEPAPWSDPGIREGGWPWKRS